MMSEKDNNSEDGVASKDGQPMMNEVDRFFELCLDMLCVAGTDGYFKCVNPAFEQTLGWSTEELVTKSFLDFVHPDDLSNSAAALEKLTNGSSTVTFDNRYRCRDGSYKWLSWNAWPAPNATLYGIARDITELKELERHERQVQTITNIAQDIAAAPTLDHLFQLLVHRLQAQFDFDHAFLYTPLDNCLMLQEGTGPASQQMKQDGQAIPLDAKSSPVARAARSGQPVFVPDVTQLPDWLPNPLLPDTKAELAVPITLQGKILGVLDIQNDAIASLTEHDQRLLLGLCGQIAVAIDNHRSQQELAQRVRLASFQSEVGAALSQSTGPQQMLQQCTEAMVAHLDAAFGRIWLLNPDENVLELKASAGLYTHLDGDHGRVPVGKFKIGLIAEEHEPHLTNDVLNDPRLGDKEWAEREGMVAFAGYPLLIEDRLIGVMAMFARHALKDYVLQAMELTANNIALAVENKRSETEREHLLAEVQRLATIVENHPDFIGVGTLDGQALYVNPSGLKMMGLAPDYDVSEMGASNFYPPEDAAQLVEQGIPIALKEGAWTAEARLLKADGTTLPVEQTIGINYDTAGNPVSFSITMRDITERKEAEAEQRRLFALIEATSDFIGLANPNGKTIYLNQAGRRMTGFDADEDLSNVTIAEYCPEWAAEMVMNQGIPTALQEGTWSGEMALRNRDGREIPGSQVLIAQKDADGNPEFFGTIIRDITRLKEIEETLAKRAAELETVTEIGTQIASILESEQLLQTVADLTKEGFDFYHAHIYLLNEAGTVLNLAAGAGEVGQQLVAEQWSIPLDQEASLVAQAARTRQGVIANDVRKTSAYLPNPLLPDTRSEMAIPIQAGNTVMGVLDVQSDKLDRFTDEDVGITTTLAVEVAVALQNARYFERSEEALAELDELTRRLTRQGWHSYLDLVESPRLGYSYDPYQPEPVRAETDIVERDGATTLTQPLTIRGETIGQLALTDPQALTNEAAEIIDAVAGRLSTHVENLRLSEQTQAALIEQERLTHELETVAKVSATTSTILDGDTLLQAVVDLTKESFNLYHAHIYLLNDNGDTLKLVAGAGDIGRTMVAKEWSIPLKQKRSLVARAARNRKGVLVNDLREKEDYLPNPLLPDTKSEMAVPLIVGDRLLGVLDVQADEINRFSDEDIRIHTALASQVAVAFQNANLYAEQESTITRLRELERLKSSFLANMSHELRTPLNSIIGFADIILSGLHGPLVESLENDMKVIEKNGQHLLSLINDVLDMAKIEAGRMNLQPEEFNLTEVLEETVDIAGPLANEKTLDLNLEVESGEQLTLEADRFRLRQVMINLVNNAIKFTETGSVTIQAERDDDWIRIGVHDTGIGIPPEQTEVIFEAFRQVDTSTTRKAGGTGLGLLICRHLVELHGGNLWVDSTGNPGEGSSFYVELPVETTYQASPVAE